MTTFSNILKTLRTEKNLTQKELADALNSSNKNIWNYEKGIAEPNSAMLCAIGDYFKVSVDYLLGRESEDGRVVMVNDVAENLTQSEKTLLQNYRRLNKTNQGVVDNVTNSLVESATGLQNIKRN
ncbi:MAG: helix-turn-helix transcriptional regulator [Clostridia bacterium]